MTSQKSGAGFLLQILTVLQNSITVPRAVLCNVALPALLVNWPGSLDLIPGLGNRPGKGDEASRGHRVSAARKAIMQISLYFP